MKFVAAGFSTTKNKAYGAFYSCPSCKQTVSAGESNGQVEPVGKVLEKRPSPVPAAGPDWDNIAVGKVASNFVQALIGVRGSVVTITDTDISICFSLAEKVVYWGRDSSA